MARLGLQVSQDRYTTEVVLHNFNSQLTMLDRAGDRAERQDASSGVLPSGSARMISARVCPTVEQTPKGGRPPAMASAATWTTRFRFDGLRRLPSLAVEQRWLSLARSYEAETVRAGRAAPHLCWARAGIEERIAPDRDPRIGLGDLAELHPDVAFARIRAHRFREHPDGGLHRPQGGWLGTRTERSSPHSMRAVRGPSFRSPRCRAGCQRRTRRSTALAASDRSVPLQSSS